MCCSVIPADLVFGRAICSKRHVRYLESGIAGKADNLFSDESAVWLDISSPVVED